MKVPSFLMTNFQRYFKVPLFDKMLTCRNFWQYDGAFLNIFHIWHESPFAYYYLCSVLQHQRYRNRPFSFAYYFNCLKSVQIRSFFWSVFSRIWTEYRPEKIRIWKVSTQCLKKNFHFVSIFFSFFRKQLFKQLRIRSKPWNRAPFL